MELKLFNVLGACAHRSEDEEGDFVLELTLEELACVGGGLRHDDESPKES